MTAFTVAHSMTLAGATLGFVNMPQQPVEAVIALSILFVAMEIVHWRQGKPGVTRRRPWLVAFTFGLLHGFGFAGALSEIGLPEHAIPLALLFFNLGVEAGQLIFIAAVLVAWALLRLIRWPEWVWTVPVYSIGFLDHRAHRRFRGMSGVMSRLSRPASRGPSQRRGDAIVG